MSEDLVPIGHQGSLYTSASSSKKIILIRQGESLRIFRRSSPQDRSVDFLIQSTTPLDNLSASHSAQISELLNHYNDKFRVLHHTPEATLEITASLPAGGPLSSESLPISERERRFMRCVEEVCHLHKVGHFHGSIEVLSFWLSRSGDIILLPPLGSVRDDESLEEAQARDAKALEDIYHFVFDDPTYSPSLHVHRWAELFRVLHLNLLTETQLSPSSPVINLISMLKTATFSPDLITPSSSAHHNSLSVAAHPTSPQLKNLSLQKRIRFILIAVISVALGWGTISWSKQLPIDSSEGVLVPSLGRGLLSLSDQLKQSKKVSPRSLLSSWSETLASIGYRVTSSSIARLVSREDVVNDTFYHHGLWRFSSNLFDGTLTPSQFFEFAQVSRQLALELSASFVLDSHIVGTKISESIEESIRQMVSSETKREFESALGSSIAVPTLWESFGDVITILGTRLPNSDLLQLLSYATQQGNLQLFSSLAQLALERGIWARDKEVLLSLFNQEKGRSLPLRYAMLNVLSGHTNAHDARAFTAWPERRADPFLWTIVLESEDSEARDEAYFLVTRKPFGQEILSRVVAWIKEFEWENRQAYTPLAATIALTRKENLAPMLQRLTASSHRIPLLTSLIKSREPLVIESLLNLFPNDISIALLIDISRYGPQESKLKALSKLVSVNDAKVIQSIVEGYEKESDPVVQEFYRSSFWFIKRRS
jgi:hypothetical protein